MQFANCVRRFNRISGQSAVNMGTASQHRVLVGCPSCGDRSIFLTEREDRSVQVVPSCGCSKESILSLIQAGEGKAR